MHNMLTAAEAHVLSTSGLSADVYSRVEKYIRENATRGERSVTIDAGLLKIPFALHERFKTDLRDLGYGVKYTSDQLDGDFWQILW